jgi:hypothetical protein
LKRNLFSELKRRNVLRAGALYAAGAWLIVQVATQVFPYFHIAEWVVRWTVVAAIVGFPFLLVFAWFYELTPEGLRLDSGLEQDGSASRTINRKLDRWIIAVLGVVVVLLAADKFVLHKDAEAANYKSRDDEALAMIDAELAIDPLSVSRSRCHLRPESGP